MIVQKVHEMLLLLVQSLKWYSSYFGIEIVIVVLVIDKFGGDDDGRKKKTMYIFLCDFEADIFLLYFIDENEAVNVGSDRASHEAEDS